MLPHKVEVCFSFSCYWPSITLCGLAHCRLCRLQVGHSFFQLTGSVIAIYIWGYLFLKWWYIYTKGIADVCHASDLVPWILCRVLLKAPWLVGLLLDGKCKLSVQLNHICLKCGLKEFCMSILLPTLNCWVIYLLLLSRLVILDICDCILLIEEGNICRFSGAEKITCCVKKRKEKTIKMSKHNNLV